MSNQMDLSSSRFIQPLVNIDTRDQCWALKWGKQRQFVFTRIYIYTSYGSISPSKGIWMSHLSTWYPATFPQMRDQFYCKGGCSRGPRIHWFHHISHQPEATGPAEQHSGLSGNTPWGLEFSPLFRRLRPKIRAIHGAISSTGFTGLGTKVWK